MNTTAPAPDYGGSLIPDLATPVEPAGRGCHMGVCDKSVIGQVGMEIMHASR